MKLNPTEIKVRTMSDFFARFMVHGRKLGQPLALLPAYRGTSWRR